MQYKLFLVALTFMTAELMASFTTWAQHRYHFENLTTADGLSDNRITCMLKDKTGFMWIGTENGLNRYDGHTFLIYNTGAGKRSISNPFINDVEQDANGSLWVATQSGLNVISAVSDSIHIFSSDEDKKAVVLPSDLIWDILIDNAGKVWCAADVKDLCYYDVVNKTFHYFPWKEFAVTLFPKLQHTYLSIRKIYRKSDDELWLGTSIGLFSFSISTQTFKYHNSEDVDHFTQLHSTVNGETVYFIQSPFPNLEILSPADNKRRNVPWKDIPLATSLPDAQRSVNMLVWLPAGNDVLEINTVTQEATRIQHITDDVQSLLPGNVRTVYQDDKGLVWIGTSSGVSRFNPFMTPFFYTPVIPSTQSAEASDNDLYRINPMVHTVFYSKPEGKYYISSPATSSLIIRDSATGKSKTFTSILGIPLKRCSVIFEDSQGLLWILATPHAFTFDRRTQKFAVSPFRSDASNTLFTDMAEDNQGNYWFTCFNDGLYRYNLHDRVRKKVVDEHFNSPLPTSLYFDRELSKLWIGTFEHGLFGYDIKYQSFTRVAFSKKTNGIPSALVTDVTKDKNNTIWISTYAGGITHCTITDNNPEKFISLTAIEGLPENNIFSLQVDHSGYVWATSYKGISRISPDGMSVENFDGSKGLNLMDFHCPITITSDGAMLTAAGQGFIQFDPGNVNYRSPSFPVIITSVSVHDVPLKQNLLHHEFTLPHTRNDVEFHFAALTFSNTSRTMYEYKLEGINENWIASGNTNQVRYNNLAPGHYAFAVRACDFSGTCSAGEASLSFYILPPWWTTWWFRILCGGAMVFMIIAVFRIRIGNERKKAETQRQIAELKGQALRAQMNPHFIFNSLNAIQELIISENYTGAYQYLSKFSRLLRLVLNSSEKNFIPLSNEIEMCRLYVALESLRFQHSFHYSIDSDETDEDVTLFPTLLVQPFVENAIWHGLMQKEGEKILSIRFEEKDQTVCCTIRDNGIGMKKAAEIKAGKTGSAHFTSKGIPLVMQRVEALNAGNHKATIVITHCEDEKGNATGTLVEISIATINEK